jgi:hypothetical protein
MLCSWFPAQVCLFHGKNNWPQHDIEIVFSFVLNKKCLLAGLPDGLFSNQKSQFGYILGGFGMENVDIFYDFWEHFTAILSNLWHFGIVCSHLVYFFPFWYVWTKKNLATLPASLLLSSFRK